MTQFNIQVIANGFILQYQGANGEGTVEAYLNSEELLTRLAQLLYVNS